MYHTLQSKKLSLFSKREYGKAGKEIQTHKHYLLHHKRSPSS